MGCGPVVYWYSDFNVMMICRHGQENAESLYQSHISLALEQCFHVHNKSSPFPSEEVGDQLKGKMGPTRKARSSIALTKHLLSETDAAWM